MNSLFTTAVILVCLSGAIWLGMVVRWRFPEQHFSADTKETVKLAMGLVGAMFLILEMDRPFKGLIRISGEPWMRALMTMNQP
jgi:hypothetical protein